MPGGFVMLEWLPFLLRGFGGCMSREMPRMLLMECSVKWKWSSAGRQHTMGLTWALDRRRGRGKEEKAVRDTSHCLSWCKDRTLTLQSCLPPRKTKIKSSTVLSSGKRIIYNRRESTRGCLEIVWNWSGLGWNILFYTLCWIIFSQKGYSLQCA